jgi:hypothetical protein
VWVEYRGWGGVGRDQVDLYPQALPTQSARSRALRCTVQGAVCSRSPADVRRAGQFLGQRADRSSARGKTQARRSSCWRRRSNWTQVRYGVVLDIPAQLGLGRRAEDRRRAASVLTKARGEHASARRPPEMRQTVLWLRRLERRFGPCPGPAQPPAAPSDNGFGFRDRARG